MSRSICVKAYPIIYPQKIRTAWKYLCSTPLVNRTAFPPVESIQQEGAIIKRSSHSVLAQVDFRHRYLILLISSDIVFRFMDYNAEKSESLVILGWKASDGINRELFFSCADRFFKVINVSPVEKFFLVNDYIIFAALVFIVDLVRVNQE